jgi:hypothetical protein
MSSSNITNIILEKKAQIRAAEYIMLMLCERELTTVGRSFIKQMIKNYEKEIEELQHNCNR